MMTGTKLISNMHLLTLKNTTKLRKSSAGENKRVLQRSAQLKDDNRKDVTE